VNLNNNRFFTIQPLITYQSDTMNLNIFKTTKPRTREADYYIGCLNGSIFMDFDKSTSNQIFLKRISFDGFGCCNLRNNESQLSPADTEKFINELKNQEELEEVMTNQEDISNLVFKLIEMNKDEIWSGALKKYQLLGHLAMAE